MHDAQNQNSFYRRPKSKATKTTERTIDMKTTMRIWAGFNETLA